MKVTYFKETDTLYIEFREQPVAETTDLDENTILDLDDAGSVCAITIEHASTLTDVGRVSLQDIAA